LSTTSPLVPNIILIRQMLEIQGRAERTFSMGFLLTGYNSTPSLLNVGSTDRTVTLQ
jgi:hypothetical protein